MSGFFYTRIEISERLIPFLFVSFAYKFQFYDVFANVPGYRYAGIFVGERLWAAVFLMLGILQILATRSGERRRRKAILFISASVWAYWAGCIIYAQVPGFGDVIWSGIALMTFCTYYRVAHTPVK